MQTCAHGHEIMDALAVQGVTCTAVVKQTGKHVCLFHSFMSHIVSTKPHLQSVFTTTTRSSQSGSISVPPRAPTHILTIFSLVLQLKSTEGIIACARCVCHRIGVRAHNCACTCDVLVRVGQAGGFRRSLVVPLPSYEPRLLLLSFVRVIRRTLLFPPKIPRSLIGAAIFRPLAGLEEEITSLCLRCLEILYQLRRGQAHNFEDVAASPSPVPFTLAESLQQSL